MTRGRITRLEQKIRPLSPWPEIIMVVENPDTGEYWFEDSCLGECTEVVLSEATAAGSVVIVGDLEDALL